MRWALRLTGDADCALSVLCVVRDSEGRWLAGRRAEWVASWAGVWALGAGGAVDAGESPVGALTRELAEEWSVEAERLSVEALLSTPGGLILLVGQAWLPPGRRGRPRPRARRPRLVAARSRMSGPTSHIRNSGGWHRCWLQARELPHSQVPLVHALGDLHRAARDRFAGGMDGAKYVLGWAHGIGWIIMSLLCVDAVVGV